MIMKRAIGRLSQQAPKLDRSPEGIQGVEVTRQIAAAKPGHGYALGLRPGLSSWPRFRSGILRELPVVGPWEPAEYSRGLSDSRLDDHRQQGTKWGRRF
jgi:hypothetical protein